MRTRRIITILAMLIAAMLPSAGVSADPPDPDSPMSFVSTNVRAYTNLIEGADLLVIAHYNIPYATLPADSADVNYIAQMFTSGGSLIGNTVPYPYNDQGYGQGVIGFYLDATETQAAGLSNGTTMTAWPVVGIQIVLQGNPTVFATPPTTGLQTLASGAYTGDQTRAVNQTTLGAKILQIAGTLQAAWQVTLVNESEVLNAAGTQYFGLAIPGIRSMAPGIYDISSSALVYPTPQPTPVGGSYATTAETRYDSVTWFPQNDMFKAFLVFLVVIGIVTIFGWFMGSGGALMAVLFCAIFLLPIAVDQGFVRYGYGALIIAAISALGVLRVTRDMQ